MQDTGESQCGKDAMLRNDSTGTAASAVRRAKRGSLVVNAGKRIRYTSNARRGRALRSPQARRFLVGDVFRKEISEEPEKSQPRDAVGRHNPGAASFASPKH